MPYCRLLDWFHLLGQRLMVWKMRNRINTFPAEPSVFAPWVNWFKWPGQQEGVPERLLIREEGEVWLFVADTWTMPTTKSQLCAIVTFPPADPWDPRLWEQVIIKTAQPSSSLHSVWIMVEETKLGVKPRSFTAAQSCERDHRLLCTYAGSDAAE